METSDRELISRYRRGDVDALEQLIERHRRVLFGYAMNMTRDPDASNDVFQEVWLRAIRKIGSYRDRNFGGWLVRIAHNVIVDRARRRKPEISMDREDDTGRSLKTMLAGTDAGPTDRAAARDIGARIAAAVTELPMEQREVFLLRAQAELPFKEIARVQGVSINTALARMQYALTKLRPLLQVDYDALSAG
jgi:RNA polymerase sigma-70 factor (ECF subfamily)